jgi:hypothetical protein
MKPLWPYYGSKWRDARRYGQPRHDTVIEPFAGSAGYSTFYAPRKVMLYDVDPYVVGVWSYLIRTSAAEILTLPDLDVGQSVDSLKLPQEAKWLIGFWLNRGSAQPKKTRTAYSSRTERQQLVWSQRARERIASEIDGIRHWTITQGDYREAPSIDATYYVDPPYGDKGVYYRFNGVDLPALGEWCKSLPGHVIACEQVGAEWLPFRPLASIKSTNGRSHEAIWTSDMASLPFDLFAA